MALDKNDIQVIRSLLKEQISITSTIKPMLDEKLAPIKAAIMERPTTKEVKSLIQSETQPFRDEMNTRFDDLYHKQ